MSGDAPIRLALIGCGRIAKTHLDAIAQVPELTLVAVCDEVEARARAAGEALGLPWFTDYARMLREVPCDAVTIATPSGLHPAHGVAAARAEIGRAHV